MCLALLQVYGENIEFPAIRYQDSKLVYLADSLGNQVPDYSYCGYKLSESEIPNVPIKVVVPHTDKDATQLIQQAINQVAGMPLTDGFRGAVLLEEGTYTLKGRLKITTSGVVLRGSGKNTILKAVGEDRETLIRIVGKNDIQASKTISIINDYVAVGATDITLESTSGLKVGDKIFIHRPSTQKWIDKMGMVDYGGETGWLGWKPGQRDVYWDREITAVNGENIRMNIPLTASLDKSYGQATVVPYNWSGRITNVGVENLHLISDFNKDNPKDESHSWFAITMENVKDAWVRQVEFKHFAGSAVALYETASRVTVEDCISTQPVSEIAGQRRNTFFTMGQQTLFLRCYAENGNHDFATGFCAAGPNAFVQCETLDANNFSGAIDSWATGALFDIVNNNGQALSFKNRGQDGQGAGWTAANSMFWNCSAGRIECFAPPLAQNYAYGAWAQFAGKGLWYEVNSHISPRSLFFTQLAERLNKQSAIYKDEYLHFGGESTSSPTIEEARQFTDESFEPLLQLVDYIKSAGERNPISLTRENAVLAKENKEKQKNDEPSVSPVEIKNGWLEFDGKILTGFQHNVPWWRGNPRPFAAAKAAPAITRFVPGRVGTGYTDELDSVVTFMQQNNIAAVYHNYGLWYDRRRDDHERVKRFNSESWAPFYEQPFYRSGQGEAWDRLSKYDLTQYNSWYWNRLKSFANLAEKEGKVLIHQNYFQHNILEAGAHWADSPWRPANNINHTGFPEPPPYSGDKRIYLAEQFYDVSNPVRRELHRKYIRQCLDNFEGNSNVIQSISAEYTGPLNFVEFWLDVIKEWETETGNDVQVCLSTTKDVQDSILNDPQRSKMIDIIDIRYWAYRPDGTLYAPPGGVNLAPRQHARQVKPGKRNSESVYRSVAEYKLKYPEKAVMYSEGFYTDFGWAIFMAGGSLPALKINLPDEFSVAVARMQPVSIAENGIWELEEKGKGMIFYSSDLQPIPVDLTSYSGNWKVQYLNPKTGTWFGSTSSIKGGQKQFIHPPDSGNVVWIHKK